jgi:hypothetical protein
VSDATLRGRIDRRTVGLTLISIGMFGVVVSLVATVVGLRFLGHLDAALEGSVGVAADSVDALGATVELAGDTVEGITTILERTGETTRDLAGALANAEEVLLATADLSEEQLAGSLEAVEDTLPALIQVAAVIDRTLSALSVVPFGPAYDPTEPFDDSLRALQDELDGLPETLREQADLIRDGGGELAAAHVGTAAIADDLDDLRTTLAASGELLDRYATTTTAARELVTTDEADLGRQLVLARVLVFVLGLTLAAGQLVPLGTGWLLLRPELARRVLAVPAAGSVDPPGEW